MKIKSDYFTLGEPNDAASRTLRASEEPRKKRRQIAPGGKGKFGLYVSTDSPYLKKLTSELTDLKDIVSDALYVRISSQAYGANEHIDQV